MDIREFRETDATVASSIIESCFLTLDLGGHTIEGTRIQIESNNPDRLKDKARTVRYYVAVVKGRVVGICGYDKYKVQTLFVDVHHQGKGIGKALLMKVLMEAEHEGIGSILTWATMYAEPFYKTFGFEKIGDILLPKGKKEIVLIEMKKALS